MFFHSVLNAKFIWKKFPLLLVSLYYAVGILFYFYPFLALPIFIILTSCWMQKKVIFQNNYLITSLCFMLFGIVFTHWQVKIPKTSELPLNGKALAHITTIEKQTFFFGSGYVYSGFIRSFVSTNNLLYSSLPCKIFTKDKAYTINCDYIITGELKQSIPFQYSLKPDKGILWKPCSPSFSMAELRFRIKNFVQNFLKNQFPDKHIYSFISTLATGNTPNLIISHHFRRLGLSHLLVISGFHFSILILFTKKILELLFSMQLTNVVLLLLVTSYSLYIGPTASSMRAGLVIHIYLLGKLLGRKSSALNALGGALLIQLLLHPLLLFQIGFQLSYAATFGILLFFSTYSQKLKKLLPKRNYTVTNIFLKLYQIALDAIRNQLALLLSSHTLLLPILLYHFSGFPILSFFYNLVVPILVSVCLVTIPFLWIPGIKVITKAIASFLLTIVMYAPESLNIEIYFPFIPCILLLIFLTLLFIYKLFLYSKENQNLFLDCL